MKKFALLLAFVAPVLAAVPGWHLGGVVHGDPILYRRPRPESVRFAFHNAFAELREDVIGNPNRIWWRSDDWTEGNIHYQVNVTWTPGNGDNGVGVPPTIEGEAPNVVEMDRLQEEVEEQMRIEPGGDGTNAFMVQVYNFWDELCRGGFLSVNILAYLTVPNQKRSIANLAIPSTNMTIGTFVDMTNNKTYTPPKHATIGPHRLPVTNGKPQALCKRGDIFGSMRICSVMPGTIVSKQAITMMQSLRSITGNILNFDSL
ncbi:hypothetical protein BGX26_008522, partial [Mortierella sp. AD094]